MNNVERYIRWFDRISLSDAGLVGTKNAAIGDLIHHLGPQGVRIPDGFAITVDGYRRYMQENALADPIALLLNEFDAGKRSLHSTGTAVRRLILQAELPLDLREAIIRAYLTLSRRFKTEEVDVAVRGSVVAPNFPGPSFYGQQETLLNVTGMLEVLDACKKCFASIYSDRAIAERRRLGYEHLDISLSVGIQKMVRSDLAGSGDLVTVDPETGFPRVIRIRAAWGLGENLAREMVVPDEYLVFKPFVRQTRYRPVLEKKLGDKALKMIYAGGVTSYTKNVETPRFQRHRFVLSDEEILALSRWGLLAEEHYGRPVEIEWAKDGRSGDIYVLQSRPETVHSRHSAAVLKSYKLIDRGPILTEGLSIGTAVCSGTARRVVFPGEVESFEDGSILVTESTDPEWIPLMRKAAGIVTDYGGKTSHTAVFSREMGIPAIVGTADATEVLEHGQAVTLSCTDGYKGQVLDGTLSFKSTEIELTGLPRTQTGIMMNIAGPDAAFRWWKLPCDGVGLARMEFIISELIRIHPLALIHLDHVTDRETVRLIKEMTRRYKEPSQYFVETLASGIARIAASRHPDPVVVRLSDFTTREYASLIGGAQFEIEEENPMLGFRGASRYYSDRYREAFALECIALKKVREEMGFRNVVVMVPFCRTVQEARNVLNVMADYGLERRKAGLQIHMMCEVPSNVILAHEFAGLFDGFSIGSNDLTQLVLGVDRDSGEMAYLFDEQDDAVKRMITDMIDRAHFHDRKVSICGQAPSEHPEFCRFLVEAGIDAISLDPASIIEMRHQVAAAEGELSGSEQVAVPAQAHA